MDSLEEKNSEWNNETITAIVQASAGGESDRLIAKS
jgi:hypothetical protein